MNEQTLNQLKKLGLGPDDLREANLTGASLIKANLTGADLSGADLSGADLSRADLSRASGPFTTRLFGEKYTAVAAGGYIVIGCERHTYDWWLADDNVVALGIAYDYDADDVADYMAWIELAVARQRRIEMALCIQTEMEQ